MEKGTEKKKVTGKETKGSWVVSEQIYAGKVRDGRSGKIYHDGDSGFDGSIHLVSERNP